MLKNADLILNYSIMNGNDETGLPLIAVKKL